MKNKTSALVSLILLLLFIILITIFPVVQSLNNYLANYSTSPEWQDIVESVLSWLLSLNGRFIITWLEVCFLLIFVVFFIKAIGGLQFVFLNKNSTDINKGAEVNAEVNNEISNKRSLWKNKELWLIVFLILLYMPTLGVGGLWDPWETHYGEVTRRMVERNDWISTWWENEWFFSKPILIFWLEGFSISLLGLEIAPDRVSHYIEWGLRLPVVLFSIVTVWFIYRTVKRIYNERVGLWSALILATMPQYFFVSHQAMTDILFIAPMTIGICLLILAIITPDDEIADSYKVNIKNILITLDKKSILIFWFIIWGLPQFIYIGSRPGLFEYGSLGQNNIRLSQPAYPVAGIIQAILWLIPWTWVLITLIKEQRLRRIYLIGFYLCAAIATMGKGLGGIVLPFLIVFFYLIASNDWRQLKKGEFLRGLIIFFTTASPWYVAMFIRHGKAFFNRFFIHDHINRLAVGVHGDTGTVGYFIQQLGYATFPWAFLIPGGIFGFLLYKRNNQLNSSENSRNIYLFIFMWFLITFIFFSAMMTKFHHYILPALPPLAILCAIFVDKLYEKGNLWLGSIALLIAGIGLLVVISRDFGWIPSTGTKGVERLIDLFVYNYRRPYPAADKYNYAKEFIVFGILFISTGVLSLWNRIKKYTLYFYGVSAVVFTFWCLNIYMLQLSDHWSQKQLIEKYYHSRNSASERLVAFQMNWKGENFYTGNRAVIQVSLKNTGIENWLKNHKGEQHFFITEPHRISNLKKIINSVTPGAGDRMKILIPDSNNKFKLAVTQL